MRFHVDSFEKRKNALVFHYGLYYQFLFTTVEKNLTIPQTSQ